MTDSWNSATDFIFGSAAETGEMEDILDKLSRYFQALSQMEQEFQTLVQEYEQMDHELAGKMA
ncbi:hypothetical protein NSQ26_13070 [Bacillus sp. FSL W7-1360]